MLFTISEVRTREIFLKQPRDRRPRNVLKTEKTYFCSTDRLQMYITYLFFSSIHKISLRNNNANSEVVFENKPPARRQKIIKNIFNDKREYFQQKCIYRLLYTTMKYFEVIWFVLVIDK